MPRRNTGRTSRVLAAAIAAVLASCTEAPTPAPERIAAPSVERSAGAGGNVLLVNVTNDTTAQNETPLAVNPVNPDNLLTGNNDWNYNDGCGVNASHDGGRTWTKTLPSGFIPGVTKYTNDPLTPGTGIYDFGGDPAVAFAPNGTAYFACFGYQATPPYGVALLVSRSYDGGDTWLAGPPNAPLAQASIFQGNGNSRGSTGQFPDHEGLWAGGDGTLYATWAQFNGYGSRSPVYVATSRDGGLTFSPALKVTSGSIRSDQDARIVTTPDGGTAFLVFDNGIQGGKGVAMYVSVSADHGASWSTPFRFATWNDPVCLYPPYCFNISGGQFRGPGSYPAPAYDPVDGRLYVAYADIVDGRGQVYATSASAGDLTTWTKPAVVAAVPVGDRFAAELSAASNGRLDVAFYDRSYSANALVDVTLASSSDLGATWQSTRVTRSGFDPSQYGVPSGSGIRPFIGDYNGIISLPASAGLTFTGPGKTYGSLPTNLEIYFARVSR